MTVAFFTNRNNCFSSLIYKLVKWFFYPTLQLGWSAPWNHLAQQWYQANHGWAMTPWSKCHCPWWVGQWPDAIVPLPSFLPTTSVQDIPFKVFVCSCSSAALVVWDVWSLILYLLRHALICEEWIFCTYIFLHFTTYARRSWFLGKVSSWLQKIITPPRHICIQYTRVIRILWFLCCCRESSTIIVNIIILMGYLVSVCAFQKFTSLKW